MASRTTLEVESYHKVLYRELIIQAQFTSLFQTGARSGSLTGVTTAGERVRLGWKTPASIYFDGKYSSK